jgi:hypothetical protein
MMVAVPIVLMVKMPIDQIVSVIAVGNLGMATVWSVHVIVGMRLALMPISAMFWLFIRNFHYMLIDVIAVNVVEMPVVKIIKMVFVLDPLMAAAFSVNV